MSTLAVECIKESERVCMLDECRIMSNRRQPRMLFEDRAILSLADSIHRHGILQPLSVRKNGDDFELIAGERRLRAARLLKMKRVPCIIVNIDEETSAVMSIIENIQRQDLNIFEEAMAIHTLKELYNMTQESIARTLSVSQSYVANKLRILRLSPEEQNRILEHNLTERHCRALLRLEGDQRIYALDRMINHKMNVSAAEAYVDRLCSEVKRQPKVVGGQLKDLKLFYNSIDRAVNSVKKLGVNVVTEMIEEDDCKRVTIIVRKQPAAPGP
ncbi:MAG: ParB/RepB/Spo0J family partition protein [Clostridia bacterium]|nr:ParB/RepB/Spo0J family partition protein [Clostridia bacterium]